MKVGLAQLNFHIGNITANEKKIMQAIEQAHDQKADVVIFPELAVCGYPPRDMLHYKGFVNQCLQSLENIAKASRDIAVIIGVPTFNDSGSGKSLYNSACFIRNGKIESIYNKCLLPTYDVFEEYRYFEPGKRCGLVEVAGKKLALTICEDIWNIGDDRMYKRTPMDDVRDANPDLIVNISASPFSFNQKAKRETVLTTNARDYGVPMVYVNHVGAQTDLVFDGNSLVVDEHGQICTQARAFEEEILFWDSERVASSPQVEVPRLHSIRQALLLGIRDYFRKSELENALVGLSGGIDSAVTLTLAVQALGKEHVRAILLPSPYSSQHSISDSEALCKRLGCRYDIIPIHDAFDSVKKALSEVFASREEDVTEENMQARIRGVLLMSVSNKMGSILLNTSNKSELAVGYGTLYGDMCGGLSVLGDLYKTDVYALAKFLNQPQEIIPENIITKPPSAELRPDQLDTDSLPDYELLDKILHHYIEECLTLDEIMALDYDAALVKRIVKMVNFNEYKRYQFAPVLRISDKAFGMGRRLPIVASYEVMETSLK